MNTFNLDIEQLDLDEARAALSGCRIERLPNTPPFLSKKECAAIMGVSMKVVNKLIESGQLPLTDIPDDSRLASFDLFGQQIDPPREKLSCALISSPFLNNYWFATSLFLNQKTTNFAPLSPAKNINSGYNSRSISTRIDSFDSIL
jgi:hypothetical protein